MKWIKEYKLIILGALLLAVIVIAGRAGRAPEALSEEENPFGARLEATPAASLGDRQEEPARPGRDEPRPEPPKPEIASKEETTPAEDAAADSSGEDEDEFDSAAAKLKAVEEVKAFNKELAATLRAFNPNALKTRLKAGELTTKAEELDSWIKSQDSRADMSHEDREAWQVQRDVWIEHSRDLKQVAQRLSASHGTKRKVRILARELAEDVDE